MFVLVLPESSVLRKENICLDNLLIYWEDHYALDTASILHVIAGNLEPTVVSTQKFYSTPQFAAYARDYVAPPANSGEKIFVSS